MKIEDTATGSDNPDIIKERLRKVVASLTDHMYIYAPYNAFDTSKTTISIPNTPVVVNQNCHERPI